MNAYDEALRKAAASGRAFYVNQHAVGRDEEILLADPYKTRLCCAVAHPDGTLERVVQGFSLAAALNQPQQVNE
jgi:hypothetical protein